VRAFPEGWWDNGLNLVERREPVERPAWAAFVENALFNASNPVIVDDDLPWTEAFAAALRPLVDEVRRRIGHEVLAREVKGWLGGRLARLAARTLVLELNRARVDGRLDGDTARRRFTDFVRQLGNGGLVDVLVRYPVLARILGQACVNAAGSAVEMLGRFESDRSMIVYELLGGADPGRIAAVDIARGDPHRGGRTVMVLRFENERRIVYKPRALTVERYFSRLVSWLDEKSSGITLATPRVVTCAGYGWAEFVDGRPCDDHAQLDSFYRREGALLALLYAVDCTDVHFENIIACGDQPVLVDVETLFQPRLPVARAVPDPAAAALESSVLRVALLPTMLFGRHGALDISGLGGGRGGMFPTSQVAWAQAGTDEMHLVRSQARFEGADNRPWLRGEAAQLGPAQADPNGPRVRGVGGEGEADPGEHTAALLDGFRAAYDAIARNRDEFTALLDGCADHEVRVLVRATQRYATLLDESTHPDVLTDGLERERVFDALRAQAEGDEVRRRLLPYELADLWAGDVPFFTGTPRSPDVITSSGVRVPGLLPLSGLAAATTKIAGMGDVDRRQQEWLIAAAMATRGGPVEHRAGAAARPQGGEGACEERLLAAACYVGDEIVAAAVRGSGRANWIAMEPPDERHWAVLPMGAGLASGYCGVALFLAQLGALTGAARYTALAADAAAPLPRLVEHLATRPDAVAAIGPGGFNGLGGICYTLARLGRLLGDAGLLRCLGSAVDLLASLDDVTASGAGTARGGAAAGAGGFGATGAAGGVRCKGAAGVASGLGALVAVYEETGLPAAAALARRYADWLVELPVDGHADGSGFLGGPAGVGWALLRYSGSGIPDGFRAAAVPSPRHASGIPDSGMPSWIPDSDSPDPAAAKGCKLLGADGAHRRGDHSWCAGAAGLALAEAAAADLGYGVELGRRAAVLATRPPLLDTSLCHGELGVVEAFIELAARGVEPARRELRGRRAWILGTIDRHAHRCGTPGGVPSPGMMNGLAGIGYGLLRLGFASEVPSVLTLQSGNE
jgi:lantibiotic modifying enzyme